jgi:hypothetical protein
MVTIQSCHVTYDNEDHNSMHACDVLQCVSYFLLNDTIGKSTPGIDVLAIYIAAIIHDHDHPGYTNNFIITTQDPKAIMYNDKSVLENHHLASSFKVLCKQENNFLENFSKADRRTIRETVIDLVLATDLTHHFTLLSIFKGKVSNPDTFNPAQDRQDRLLLYKMIMKCADVSNPTRNIEIYIKWCKLITEEFFRQGDMEKSMGIPVSPYMDRDNINIPSCQIGFVDYVVKPLFEAFGRYIEIPQILLSLEENREYWYQYIKQG